MITVIYAPSDNGSIGPNGEKIMIFNTHAEFRDWVPTYVCSSCIEDFREWNERDPVTISDYLSHGCGCEIDIDDPDNLIYWDDVILDSDTKSQYMK